VGEAGQEEPQWRCEACRALHALYEDRKLDMLKWPELRHLAELLLPLAAALGWHNHMDHYARLGYVDPLEPVMGSDWNNAAVHVDPPPVPDMHRVLLGVLQGREPLGEATATEMEPDESNGGDPLGACLPRLVQAEAAECVQWSIWLLQFYRRLRAGGAGAGSMQATAEALTALMVECGFGLEELDRVPCGVALPLREALAMCRAAPPSGWPPAAFTLVGREDLAAAAAAAEDAEAPRGQADDEEHQETGRGSPPGAAPHREAAQRAVGGIGGRHTAASRSCVTYT
ncbi:hypothetical protein CYMTET_30118, partial [Cymbomonas tetramitiformis]